MLPISRLKDNNVMNHVAVCFSEIFNSLNQSSLAGMLATSCFKIKMKGARMGYRSEVKCGSRKGKTLSSVLRGEEKEEERERETGRGKLCSPFMFKAHTKQRK